MDLTCARLRSGAPRRDDAGSRCSIATYVGQSADEVAGEIQSRAPERLPHPARRRSATRGRWAISNSYIASYAGFVADVAALGADAIEIWNEPNIDREWPAGMIYGAEYTQLLAAAYTAIKARAPVNAS